MQQSLLDFFSDDPEERVIARLRILAREILGDKARIEKISICRSCSRYAVIVSFLFLLWLMLWFRFSVGFL